MFDFDLDLTVAVCFEPPDLEGNECQRDGEWEQWAWNSQRAEIYGWSAVRVEESVRVIQKSWE